ncbi:MAG: Ig-like domain-containing protein, partial [Muribaculaceae bacterium]|nr:Ig-like domain-containing protein [Muribaculaceae bacterium]
VTWKSSDESVVTVSATGEVTPVGEGTATVTATTANDKVATCVVTVSSDNVDVEKITLDKNVLDLAAGQTATLTATVTPDNATDPTVEWTSEDDEIATVSDQGVVTAKAGGTTVITATSSNGLHATCTVNVIVPATEVTLDKTSVELQVNKTYTLTATVLPEEATDHNVTWTSENEAVATVVDGKITAKALGETTITAACGDVKATCAVKVVPTPVESVKISPASLHLTAGDESKLTATISPSGATDKSVTWTSSDETVVTVSATGEVKALKAGSATITVTSSNGKTATCPVEVEALDIPVESVSISSATLNLTEGEKATLTAMVNPSDATDSDLEWTSSNSKVVTVSAAGEVTAIKAGTARITVASHNGKSASCTVTVTAKTIEVTGITLDVTEKTIVVGETLTIKATVTPENATDAKNVVWTSSDESVATVKDGVVTAVAIGKATITAEAGGKTAKCVVTVDKKSAVEAIGFDSNAPVKVYDLNGRYISDKVEGLAEGVYVIRQGDNAKKVNIR